MNLEDRVRFPGEPLRIEHAPVAKQVRHPATNRKIVGANPTGGIDAAVAEQQTRCAQNAVPARAWGCKSLRRHCYQGRERGGAVLVDIELRVAPGWIGRTFLRRLAHDPFDPLWRKSRRAWLKPRCPLGREGANPSGGIEQTTSAAVAELADAPA